jgi:hypothetical protein
VIWVALAVLAASPAVAQLNQPLHTDGWILAAAHAPGLHGSIWRTDLWIARLETADQVRLRFCASDTDNSNATEYVVDFETQFDKVAYIEDVVGEFLGVGGASWTGAIHYTSTGPVQVWARVYSIDTAGTASYGQLIEGIPTADMSPDDDPWDFRQQQYLMAVKHTADDRYRVNIGVVNPTEIEALYRVQAYSADGNCPPSDCMAFYVTVPPFSMVQTSDPFADWQEGGWNAVQIQAKCKTDGAGGFVYASVVDNATNDAFFVRGVKKMAPTEQP